MANERFSIKEALNYGWNTFKSNAPFFLGLMVVMVLVSFVPDWTSDKVFSAGTGLHFVSKIILRIVGLILGMITTKISLDIVDHGQADLSRLSELAGVFVPYFFGKVLYGFIVLIGLALLIVPGIIASYMFLYVGYVIIDRKIGPIDALKESRVITDGVKWDLFLFSLVVALINIGGVLCLLVGLFVTIPITLMASAYVYRKLSPAQASAA